MLLSIVMVFTVFSVALTSSAFAADTKTNDNVAVTSVDLGGIKIPTSWDELGGMMLKSLYNLADKIIDALVKSINRNIPSVKFEQKENFTSDMFFEGMEDYLTSPAANSVWSLGYGSASLQTGDELDGKHYVGGSLSFPKQRRQQLSMTTSVSALSQSMTAAAEELSYLPLSTDSAFRAQT